MRKITLRSAAGEGVLIVASISLAFGIQAGWDERQERLEEYRLVRSLEEEFTEARDSLLSVIERHGQWSAVAAALAEFGVSGGSASVPDFGADVGFESVLGGVITTHLKTGSLDGALSSGRLDLISSPEIRSRLAGWPRAAGEFLEKQHYLWDLAVETRPLLLASVPVAEALLSQREVVLGLGSPQREPTSPALSRAFVDFLSSKEGQNDAAERALWEAFAVRDGRALLGVLDELLVLLRAELS